MANFIIFINFIEVDPRLAGLSISYVMTLPGMFQWCIRQTAEVSNLVSKVY